MPRRSSPPQLRRASESVFLLSLWLVATTLIGGVAAQTPPSLLPVNTTNLCYFMFGDPSDLGWTFQFNVGRSTTHNVLRQHFPSLNINSVAVLNVANVVNKSTYAESWIASGCSCIITNNNALLGSSDDHEYLQGRYANVCFIQLNEEAYDQPRFPNFIYYQFDATAGYYYAGVVAAMQAPAKIGFLAAWEEHRNPVEAVNGFLFGVASVSANLPVEIINMRSWYDPGNESIAAELLLNRRGCSLIARYSDPRTVDSLISNTGNPNMFSIGSHSDLQLYVGDSVLSSVFVSWEVMLLPMLTSWLAKGAFDSSLAVAYGVREGVVTPSRVTPASRKGVAAVADSVLAKLQTSMPYVVCGRNLKTWTGVRMEVDSSTNCVTPAQQYTGFVNLGNAKYFGAFPRPTDCPAGTTYSYDTTSNITLVCTPCPANTYSNSGSAFCAACPIGTESRPNSTSCSLSPVPNPFNAGMLAAIIAPVTIVAIAIGVVVTIAVLRLAYKERVAYAPTKPPLCIIVTRIELADMLWQNYASIMQKAIRLHHEAIREVLAAYSAYEVSSSGDGFVIACDQALDGVLVSMKIQEALYAVKWPHHFRNPEEDTTIWRGLRAACGVVWCSDIQVHRNPIRGTVDYTGVELDLAKKLATTAVGGQTLCMEDVFIEARKDADFGVLVRAETCMGTAMVDIHDILTTVRSIVPLKFAARTREFTSHCVDDEEHIDFPEPLDDPLGAQSDSFGTSRVTGMGTTLNTLFAALTPATQRAVIAEVLCVKRNVPLTATETTQRYVAEALRARASTNSSEIIVQPRPRVQAVDHPVAIPMVPLPTPSGEASARYSAATQLGAAQQTEQDSNEFGQTITSDDGSTLHGRRMPR